MTEQATVVRADGHLALVRCADHQGCKSCGSAFCRIRERSYEAEIEPGIEVKPSDTVTVEVSPAGAIRAGFVVLILPLLAFVAAYFLAGSLQSEPLRVLAGTIGMAATFLVVYLSGKRRTPERPRIVSVIR